jgi:hypothetical protein
MGDSLQPSRFGIETPISAMTILSRAEKRLGSEYTAISGLRTETWGTRGGRCVVNRPAVEAGVEVFYAGGDFADGLFA